MSVIGAEELVFYKDDDNHIYSGGFHVNSVLFKLGVPPIHTLHNPNSGGGGKKQEENVSELFNDLAIPNWLLSNPSPIRQFGGVKRISETDEVIEDILYDELLRLMSVEEPKQIAKTKKQKSKLHRITRKNKLR
jgi:hypothetical protein